MKAKKLNQDQSGLVAIIVTLIIMFVLSITVISFAITSQRNGRQALDRQLSTQAYYAAESGINDALAVIKTDTASGTAVAKTICGLDGHYLQTPVIDSGAGVEYTCLLVDPSPTELIYEGIQTEHSQVIPFKAPAGAAYVELNWNAVDYTAPINGNCPASPPTTFQPAVGAGAWNCNVSGVVRIDLVEFGGASTFNRASPQTKTFFAYPIHDSATPPATPTPYDVSNGAGSISNGSVVPAICSDGGGATAPPCHLRLNLIPGKQTYLRIRPIYKPISLHIIAPANSGGGNLPIDGSQATIDSTGKAKDVLRRVKVNVSVTGNNNSFPDFAIQASNSICKVAFLTNNQVDLDPALVPATISPDPLQKDSCDPTVP